MGAERLLGVNGIINANLTFAPGSWSASHFVALIPVIRQRSQIRFYSFVYIMLLWFCNYMFAETGILSVVVKDVQNRPLKGVRIGLEGDGGSGITDDAGKVRLQLAAGSKERAWVLLQILQSPPRKDLVMVSPWDYRVQVPSFENESENFVKVFVVQRGDRAVLESGRMLAAAAAEINRANARKTARQSSPNEDLAANLAAVAKKYGVKPTELDAAILAWASRTKDPYNLGLADLYQRDYSKASTEFAESLSKREESLAADQTSVVDSAFFLGLSLSAQARYREANQAFQRCNQLRPNDAAILNTLALTDAYSGNYNAAESTFRAALTIREHTLGAEDPDLAQSLDNLGAALEVMGKYGESEALIRRALDIRVKVRPTYHQDVADSLRNLATLLIADGRYAEAKPLLERAIRIYIKLFGPDHFSVADAYNGLAEAERFLGNYKTAEGLYVKAIDIDERNLGPNHPDLAGDLNNYGELMREEGDFAQAESLHRRALAIDQKMLGSEHSFVARDLNNLALVLEQGKKDYTEAERLFREALRIDEQSLGPDSPDVATNLNNLGMLLKEEGNAAEAESLLYRALAIAEQTLGPNHPTTQLFRHNLEDLRSANPHR